MAQVGRSQFESARVSSRPGEDVGPCGEPLRGFAGYEGRVGDAGRRVRESVQLAMPSKPVLAAIVVLMVACVVLGAVALRTTLGSGVVIERGDAAATGGEQAAGLAAGDGAGSAEGVSVTESDSNLAGQGAPDASAAVVAAVEEQTYICVYVAGNVYNPGVYTLPEGARVYEALDAAGGATPQADLSAINLAQPLADSQMVYVAAAGEQPAATQAAVSGAAASQQASALVNVNTADAETLVTLNGIGPSLAQAIIDDRERNGAFASVEDLTRVSGIGEKTLAKFADKVCV